MAEATRAGAGTLAAVGSWGGGGGGGGWAKARISAISANTGVMVTERPGVPVLEGVVERRVKVFGELRAVAGMVRSIP